MARGDGVAICLDKRFGGLIRAASGPRELGVFVGEYSNRRPWMPILSRGSKAKMYGAKG